MGSQWGIDAPARLHNWSSAFSMFAANSPRIQRSWMQWAPATPSLSASARSNDADNSLSVVVRSGRRAGDSRIGAAQPSKVFATIYALAAVRIRGRRRILSPRNSSHLLFILLLIALLPITARAQ